MDKGRPFFLRGWVLFEGCKLQLGPEQLLFHELDKKSDEHFPPLGSISAVPEMRTKSSGGRKDSVGDRESKRGLL